MLLLVLAFKCQLEILLLITLAFCLWYSESNTTGSKYDLYYTGLVCINRCYAKFATKSKTYKFVGFKEQLESLPKLRQPKEKSPLAKMRCRMKN